MAVRFCSGWPPWNRPRTARALFYVENADAVRAMLVHGVPFDAGHRVRPPPGRRVAPSLRQSLRHDVEGETVHHVFCPARPQRLSSSGFDAIASRHCANATGSHSGTIHPPDPMTSGIAPLSEPITGTPQLCASRMTRPNCSRHFPVRESRIKASTLRMKCATSAALPQA